MRRIWEMAFFSFFIVSKITSSFRNVKTFLIFMFYRQWHPRDRSVQSVLNVTMTKTNVLGCWVVDTASARVAWKGYSVVTPLIVPNAEIQLSFLLGSMVCQRILRYWTWWTKRHPNKMLKVRIMLALTNVKLVTRNTLPISVALTAKKTCALLRLSFILATRQVVITGLFPMRSWKQILSCLLYRFSVRNITINSAILTKNVIVWFVETVTPLIIVGTSV